MSARILIVGKADTISTRLAEIHRMGIVPAGHVIDSSARRVPPLPAARGSGEAAAVADDPLPPFPRSSAAVADVPRRCHVHTLGGGANFLNTRPGTVADDLGTLAALMALAAFLWMPWWLA